MIAAGPFVLKKHVETHVLAGSVKVAGRGEGRPACCLHRDFLGENGQKMGLHRSVFRVSGKQTWVPEADSA
jgi:hypothetical protein